jgi:hypothetical protein
LHTSADSIALTLPEQLRQTRHVDGNPPRLVGGQHLRLVDFGRVLAAVEITDRPAVVAIADRCGASSFLAVGPEWGDTVEKVGNVLRQCF